MLIKFENVQPIYPGYDSVVTIGYAQDFWDSAELATARLVAQLRAKVDGAVLTTVDTANGTLERDLVNRELTLRISATESAKLPEKHVIFDFVRIDGAEKAPVPGRWQWPVMMTVTRGVA